jgi:hypothetical protein
MFTCPVCWCVHCVVIRCYHLITTHIVPIFDHRTSPIKSRSVTHSTITFGHSRFLVAFTCCVFCQTAKTTFTFLRQFLVKETVQRYGTGRKERRFLPCDVRLLSVIYFCPRAISLKRTAMPALG